MTDSLNNIRNTYLQVSQSAPQPTKPSSNETWKLGQNGTYKSFEQVLNESFVSGRSESLKFSKHASDRLSSRNIDLSANQLERLENGVSRAQNKGIQESLVLVDDVAFIVNIKNNTVVTAVNDMDEQIFTNIDGAVIC